MKTASRLLPLLLSFFAHPQSAWAQSVIGIVTDYRSGDRIAGAAVAAFGDGHAVVSSDVDSSGTFVLRLPRPGRYNLVVTALGYRSVERVLELDRAEEATVEIMLSPDAIPVEAIRVTATRRLVSLGIAGYEDRLQRYRALGIGRFVTREEIDQMPMGPPASYLRGMIDVELRPVRPASTSQIPLMRRHGITCKPAAYIDGMRVDAIDLDDLAGGTPIEGIEVYRGPARSPGTHSDPNGCGVILVWTRSHLGEPGGGIRWLTGRRALAASLVFLTAGVLLVR